MSYIGSTPTTQSFISGTDYFNGTGSQTAFTLSRTVASVNDVEAVVNNVVQRPNDAYTISGTTITFTSAPSSGTSNVYVRYLSTTTQSITPSQNTVSYASWNSDLQSETWAFRNRIINGAMVIDQRNAGASVTPTDTYTLDRWEVREDTDGAVTCQQVADAPAGFVYSAKITTTTADASLTGTQRLFFRQPIEGNNVADLAFGTASAATFTLSFWAKSSLTGTFGGAVSNQSSVRSYAFTYTINAANTWEYKTVTIAGDTSGTWQTGTGTGLNVFFALGMGPDYSGTAGSWVTATRLSATGAVSVIGTLNATWQVTGVQLEKGSTATSFDYRPYGTELQLAQRYAIVYGGNSVYEAFAYGFATATTVMTGQLALPVPLRATPSFSVNGSAVISDGNTGFTIFVLSIPSIQTSLQNLTLQATTSGLTQFRPYRIEANNNTTVRLTVSAEL